MAIFCFHHKISKSSQQQCSFSTIFTLQYPLNSDNDNKTQDLELLRKVERMEITHYYYTVSQVSDIQRTCCLLLVEPNP